MPVRRNARGKWFYRKRVKMPDGSRVEITGTPSRNTKEAAEQAERAHIDRALNPRTVPVKKEVPKLKDFEKQFVEVYAVSNNKPSEVASKEAMLKHHLVPSFGHLKLDQIGIRQLEEYKARKLKDPKRPLDPKTINNHLTCLRRLLSVAVEWGILDHVPPVKWLRVPEQKFDFLTFEECERLLEAADREWAAMVTLAAKAGLRLGELIGLGWDDVDLVAGRLMVRHAVARGVIGTPKNGRTERSRSPGRRSRHSRRIVTSADRWSSAKRTEASCRKRGASGPFGGRASGRASGRSDGTFSGTRSPATSRCEVRRLRRFRSCLATRRWR